MKERNGSKMVDKLSKKLKKHFSGIPVADDELAYIIVGVMKDGKHQMPSEVWMASENLVNAMKRFEEMLDEYGIERG